MTFTKEFQPTTRDTAAQMGSGTLMVLATPALIAFAENTCHESVAEGLAKEVTTVGTAITIKHLAASKVTEKVVITSQLTEQTEKKLSFTYQAHVSDRLVAKGTHQRAIIDEIRFLSKLE